MAPRSESATLRENATDPQTLRDEALNEHTAFLRRFVTGLLGDRDGVDDVVQDTWVSAIERPAKETRSMRAWLAGVARNLVRQRHRGAARRERREYLAARPDRLPSSVDDIERLDLLDRVVAAVRGLDEPYRSTLLLRYYDGLGPSEIASAQGLPVATVKTRLRRGLERVRAILDEADRAKAAADPNARSWRAVLAPLSLALPGLPAADAADTSTGSGAPEAVSGGAVSAGATGMGMGVMATAAGLAGVAVIVAFSIWFTQRDSARQSNPPTDFVAVRSTDEATSDPEIRHDGLSSAATNGSPTPPIANAKKSLAAPPIVTTSSSEAWSVSGRVFIGETDMLFAGASLRASMIEKSSGSTRDDPWHEVVFQTRDDGTFDVALSPPTGPSRLRITSNELTHVSPGYSWILVEGEEAPADVEVRMFETTSRVYGTIRDHRGEAIEGARVWSSDDDRKERDHAVSDASGVYELSVSPRSSQPNLFAFAPGYGLRPMRVAIDEPVETDVDFELAPERRAIGRVVDNEGIPIEGVSVTGHTYHALQRFAMHRTETDADGRFTLGGFDPRGPRTSIAIRHSGYVPRGFPLGSGTLDVEAEVVLERAVALEGLVLDRDDVPLAKAHLTITFSDRLRGFLQERTVTGLDGTFRFEGLYAATYDLEVEHPEAGSLRARVTAPGDGVIRYAEQEMSFAGGRVVDAAGDPIEGVSVYFDAPGSIDGRSTSTHTDADGAFSIELPASRVDMTLHADGYVRQRTRLDALGFEGRTFTLQPAVALRGLIVDAVTGEPIPAFRVGLFHASAQLGDVSVSSWSGEWSRLALRPLTSDEGIFETDAEFLAGAVIGVQAIADGYGFQENTRVVIGGDPTSFDVEFRLVRVGKIEGFVIDAAGAPVAGARVRSFDKMHFVSTNEASYSEERRSAEVATTDSEGFFRLDEVKPGDRSVVAMHESWAPGVEGPFEVASGETATCTIRMTHGCRIDGIVVDEEGRPMADVRVSANKSDPRGLRVKNEGRTDAEGRFTLEDLPPGDYQISRNNSRGHARLVDYVTLENDETRVLRLDPIDGTATLIVNLPPGNGKRHVTIWQQGAHAIPFEERLLTRIYETTEDQIIVRGIAAGAYLPISEGHSKVVDVAAGATVEVLLEPHDNE